MLLLVLGLKLIQAGHSGIRGSPHSLIVVLISTRYVYLIIFIFTFIPLLRSCYRITVSLSGVLLESFHICIRIHQLICEAGSYGTESSAGQQSTSGRRLACNKLVSNIARAETEQPTCRSGKQPPCLGLVKIGLVSTLVRKLAHQLCTLTHKYTVILHLLSHGYLSFSGAVKLFSEFRSPA